MFGVLQCFQDEETLTTLPHLSLIGCFPKLSANQGENVGQKECLFHLENIFLKPHNEQTSNLKHQ